MTAPEDVDQDTEREKADWDAEIALHKAVHDARLEVAKAAIDRGQAAAEFVRNAAAGIVTIYSGLLGLVFGFAEGARQLPSSGVIPGIFLGFSLASAAFYVAFLTRAPAVTAPTPSTSMRVLAERRINVFTDWVTGIALARVFWLHAAVVALSFGVLFLPAVFTSISPSVLWSWFWAAVGFNVVIAAITTLLAMPTSGPDEPLPNGPPDGNSLVPEEPSATKGWELIREEGDTSAAHRSGLSTRKSEKPKKHEAGGS